MESLERFGDEARSAREGRLLSRPAPPTDAAAPRGLQPLGLDDERDGLLYLPPHWRADRPAPLLVMLHGAGASGEDMTSWLMLPADRAGLVVLAPDSRRATWDLLGGGYGPDVAFLDEALRIVFARQTIDPARVAIGGFSDGASYALSLGLDNGALFSRILALSPGFAAPQHPEGRPRIFVSHGTADRVLPIDRCSRRLVPRLEAEGYDVRYVEYAGGHSIPPEIAREGLSWLLR